MQKPNSPSAFESRYGSNPLQCHDLDILFIGSGIGLALVSYLLQKVGGGSDLRIAVADAGPFDLITHVAHTDYPRFPFIREGMERIGGKLSLWGASAPRPRREILKLWPYDLNDLERRFDIVENQMGVSDLTPKSNGILQARLSSILLDQFPESHFQNAPLAINRDGRRWCPLNTIPDLCKREVKILPRFRCTRLLKEKSRIAGVCGTWSDGTSYTLKPKFVVLGVGVESSIPLLRKIAHESIQLEPADHIRIDLHGKLPSGHLGTASVDDLGIGVLLMEYSSRKKGIPAHFEIKVAPKGMWVRGYMQSSDNLLGDDPDDRIYVQLQCISAMHDRLPCRDLLNVDGIPPVMSARDAELHGELVQMMNTVSNAIGLTDPTFSFRPLLTNHHCYGAYRVDKTVTKQFQLKDIENLFILPPSAFVDVDDDANPTLKSIVLGQYAMDELIARTTGRLAMAK